MARHSETVIVAILDMVRDALPDTKVERDSPWPARPEAAGEIILRDGDPGEPEMTLSPLAYTYNHAIRLEVFGPTGTDRYALLDAMLTPLGAAVEANRTLGGLTDWLEPSSGEPDDVVVDNGQPVRAVMIDVVATYTTHSPLG